MDRSGPAGTATAGTPDAAVILRVLRVCLHSGFAVLLLVALVRLLGTGLQGTGWYTLGLALILAAVYLLGTVLEKRHSTDPSRFDPRRYSRLWLAAVCLLWLLLIWASADFVWLAFPLFFLQLHVLPLRLALPAIALSTVLVIVALWFHNTGADGGALQLPMVLGPAFGAAFAVVTGLCTGRCIWKPRNSGSPPRNCAAPAPNLPAANTTPVRWPSGPGWPAKSTTPWPRASPASC